MDADAGNDIDTDMAPGSSSYGPIRTDRNSRSSPLRGTKGMVAQDGVHIEAMDDDGATVDYEPMGTDSETVDYNDPLEIDDHEMKHSRKREAEGEEKMKRPRYPMAAPKVKKEGQRKPKAVAPADTDDEVQISAVQPTKNKDINFWKEQSPNELRAQLKLRDLRKFRDEWAFKDKNQLMGIIQDMIKKGTW